MKHLAGDRVPFEPADPRNFVGAARVKRLPMVEITLPRNSRVKTGKTWNKPQGRQGWREFRIYRWDPEEGGNPRVDTYYVEEVSCGPMVLDALRPDFRDAIEVCTDVGQFAALVDSLLAGDPPPRPVPPEDFLPVFADSYPDRLRRILAERGLFPG